MNFRGDRNYIHSTSLCNYFVELHENISDFEITLRDWILRSPLISLEPTGQVKGVVKLTSSDIFNTIFYYIQESNIEVTKTEPFDETLMDEMIFYDPLQSNWQILESNHKDQFTFFDRAICGGKHLIEHIFNSSKKLILSKLSVELKNIPNNQLNAKIFVKIESHLGDRLYKLSISDKNHSKIGEMVYYGK